LIKRVFDLFLAVLLIILFLPPMLLVALAIKFTSSGPIIFWSQRVGKNNQLFWMPKFRTMLVVTPNVATHLLVDANRYLTPVGSFLRKSSLDELPQLWSVIRGDMSFVGPRPALFNQIDLNDLRTSMGVHKLTPGITGWAQINGRDELEIVDKVRYDREYLDKQGLLFDIWVLWLTAIKVFRREGIFH
jgi:O-antigen biosynthesis protein WbqP